MNYCKLIFKESKNQYYFKLLPGNRAKLIHKKLVGNDLGLLNADRNKIYENFTYQYTKAWSENKFVSMTKEEVFFELL